MTELSKEILENRQVRNTKKQKDDFIAFLREKLPGLEVEESGLAHSRNLVLGDVDTAEVVFGAHYDTCATLPFPNFLTPKNFLLYLLYNFAVVGVVIVAAFLVSFFTALMFHSFIVTQLASLAVWIAALALMLAGKPNPHTVNDNTSGVVTLCEIYSALSEEQRKRAAFVFFDNEELGLLGSRQFLKRHKVRMKETLLLNFDCVSDGDYLMLIRSKGARDRDSELRAAFPDVPGKTVLWEKTSNTIYPSDQAGFPCAVAVAAFRKGRCGLYLSRIHTPKDTVFQEENITWLAECAKRLMDSPQQK